MKVYIHSNGCEEAKLDAQRLRNLIYGTNYVCTDDASLSDIIVFYACGHLPEKETESLSLIKKLMSLKKSSGILVVGGCLPKINAKAVRGVYQGCMIGPEEWDSFCDLINQPKERIQNVHANELDSASKLNYPFLHSSRLNALYNIVRSQKTWYIKIVTGCVQNCTYCTDRLAFRHCSSQPIDSIVSQFELGLKNDFKNFYFVGRDLGSYGYDLGYDLPTLLNKILENYHSEYYKLQLNNLSPRSLVDFYPKLENQFSNGKIFQIGSHIQSGSDRILELMGRRYSIHEWLKTAKKIKEKYPDVRLITSIIVGFPTETDQDFNKSMELLDCNLFDQVDIFMYEERPNLPSLKLGGAIPRRVKEIRFDEMRRKLILRGIIKNSSRIEIKLLLESLIAYADIIVDKYSRPLNSSKNKLNPREFQIFNERQ